jgi:hypothetical protein
VNGAMTTWTTFAITTAAEYDSRTRGSLDSGAVRPHTLAELESLIFVLERFAAARSASARAPDLLVPPPGLAHHPTIRRVTSDPIPPADPPSPGPSPPADPVSTPPGRRARGPRPATPAAPAPRAGGGGGRADPAFVAPRSSGGSRR